MKTSRPMSGRDESTIGVVSGVLMCTPPFSRRVLRLFPDADLLHVANTDHWGLLNHPEIYRAMKHWLA